MNTLIADICLMTSVASVFAAIGFLVAQAERYNVKRVMRNLSNATDHHLTKAMLHLTAELESWLNETNATDKYFAVMRGQYRRRWSVLYQVGCECAKRGIINHDDLDHVMLDFQRGLPNETH